MTFAFYINMNFYIFSTITASAARNIRQNLQKETSHFWYFLAERRDASFFFL